MKNLKLLSLLVFCLFHFIANAQTITVNNLNDSGIGSFREAISIANPNDTIRFNPLLIAMGSDTLVLDTVINIDKNLVIKGLYDTEDSLFFYFENNINYFKSNELNSSVDNLIFDSLIFVSNLDLISQASIISISNCNLTLTNCIFMGSKQNLLNTWKSNLSIINCYFINPSSPLNYILFMTPGDSLFTLEITNSIFEFNQNGIGHGIDIRSLLNPLNTVVNFRNVLFRNIGFYGFGRFILNMDQCSSINSLMNLGFSTISGPTSDYSINVEIKNSTFYSDSANINNPLVFNNGPQMGQTYFDLTLKNCTFNGGTYINNSFFNYFGPDLDELKIEGCLFNNITGFNELPIDSSGGYNLFGFPQSTGLHPTDLQNVSSSDIDLGPLQDNGGLIPTLLPSIESIAFNTGNPYDTTGAQNGPIIQRRDIGAAEIQALKFTDTAKFCGADYTWQDSVYTETGRYFEIQESNTSDLDTVFALDLSLSNLQAQAINDWGVLTANEAGANYQWIDCNTNQPIFGEISQVFEPTIAGNYQVIIDNGICLDTSTCMFINNIGLDEEIEPAIGVFVSQSILYFFGNQLGSTPFTIYNMLGQSLINGSVQDKQVNLSEFIPGIYFVKFDLNNDLKPIKFVKE